MKILIAQAIQPSPTPQPRLDGNIISIQAAASSAVTLFLGLASLYIWKNVLQPWSERQSLRISSTKTQDDSIGRELIELIKETNCDRVLVTAFTNGIETIGRRPVRKCVVTQEETRRGILKATDIFSSRSDKSGNLLMRSFIEKPFQKRSRNDLLDMAAKGFYREIGVDYMIDYFLKDDDVPLGFITLHFQETFKSNFESVQEKTLENAADIIVSNMLMRNNFWQSLWTKKIISEI